MLVPESLPTPPHLPTPTPATACGSKGAQNHHHDERCAEEGVVGRRSSPPPSSTTDSPRRRSPPSSPPPPWPPPPPATTAPPPSTTSPPSSPASTASSARWRRVRGRRSLRCRGRGTQIRAMAARSRWAAAAAIVAVLLTAAAAAAFGDDGNSVYEPCSDAAVQRGDGFTFGVAFTGHDAFFSGGVQLSPCDGRLALASRVQVALFRPKVDEISLLTVNGSSGAGFNPVRPWTSWGDRNLPDVHLGLYDDVLVFHNVEKVFHCSVAYGSYHQVTTDWSGGVGCASRDNILKGISL